MTQILQTTALHGAPKTLRFALCTAVLGLSTVAPPLAAQGETPAPQAAEEQDPEPRLAPRDVDSIETLIRYVGQKEAAVKALRLRLRSRFSMGPEEVVTVETRMSVLQGTHQQVRSVTRVGPPDEEPDLELVTESVSTPEGMWLREVDPVQGELFLRMDAELVAQTRSAAAFLEGSSSVVAPRLDPRGQALLGKTMLTELNRVFELGFSPAAPIGEGGERYWVVGGPARRLEAAAPGDPILGADRVSLFVRERDGVVTQLRAFEGGEPFWETRIEDVDLAPEGLAPADFAIALPEGREWLDIRNHPPAREQIDTLLQEARDAGWKPDGEAAEEGGKKPEDKR